MIKQTSLLLFCCAVTAITAYMVPQRFTWTATFQARGEIGPIESLPAKMQLRWLDETKRRKITSREFIDFTCALSIMNPNQLKCSATFSSRGATNRAEKIFQDMAKNSGWISQSALKNRIEQQKQTLDEKNQELANVEAEIKNVPPQDEKLNKKILDLRAQKKNTQTDIENKRSQLTMIQEAIPTQTGDNDKNAFLAKEKEILQQISFLEQKLDEIAVFLTELGAPFEKAQNLETKRQELRTETDLTMAKLVHLSSILEAHPGDEKLPDPEAFQIGDPKQTDQSPHHSLATLYWSIILGVFMYGLFFQTSLRNRIHRNKSASKIPETYSLQELENILQAPYLGEIRVRHGEDNA